MLESTAWPLRIHVAHRMSQKRGVDDFDALEKDGCQHSDQGSGGKDEGGVDPRSCKAVYRMASTFNPPAPDRLDNREDGRGYQCDPDYSVNESCNCEYPGTEEGGHNRYPR